VIDVWRPSWNGRIVFSTLAFASDFERLSVARAISAVSAGIAHEGAR
jgi:hypothetical protein